MTDDQQEYIEQVFERVRNLIHSGIWGEIRLQRLNDWIGCFENHNAALLAAYLLDNLCFRSRDQFTSMLDVLFSDARVSLNGSGLTLLTDVLKKVPTGKALSICIAPVLGPSSPPTKSGPYILRLAQRQFRMKPNWMSWPAHIHYGADLSNVIFVDDFCGTGEQFCEFAAEIQLQERHEQFPNIQFWYYVATIHDKGLKTLTEKLPFVSIRYAEHLTASSAVFSDECFNRYQIPGFQQLVCSEYDRILQAAQLPTRGTFADGFGKLSLAYAYAHATPNNTLPIFWMDTVNWTSLLDR